MPIDPAKRADHEKALKVAGDNVAHLEHSLEQARAHRDEAMCRAHADGMKVTHIAPLVRLTYASAKFVIYRKDTA